jgi:electron transfer flavoprotein alpha subunit
MESILFLTNAEAGMPLGKLALEALSAAKAVAEQLGAQWQVGLIGADCQAAADSIASCGAAGILAGTAPALADACYAIDAAAAEALCQAAGATVVVVPAGSRWNRVLAGVAHRLGGRADTHVTGLTVSNGTVQASRWYYRQRMEGTFTRPARPWLLAVESGIAPAWSGAPGSAAVAAVAMPATSARTRVEGFRTPAADQQTIRPDADLLFVTGAGWTKKQPDGQVKTADAERLIGTFLKLSRASLGSTKSLVDLGGEGQAVLPFLTHLNQVGQTGSTPRHPKGLSTCCHGEEPHTVGWRFIGERRAISLDPNCGWARGKADILYVADAFAVMEKVNQMLGS